MRSLFVIALCTSILLHAVISYPQQSDEICCTWKNTKYQTNARPQKVIFNYDGTFATYPSKDSTDPTARGLFQIDAKWRDLKGGIWYKLKMMDMYGANYTLLRITKDGDSLEYVGKPYEYPETISQEASGYRSYSRTLPTK
jgi:hypothetical protein